MRNEERTVRVYTVAHESRFLVVRNIPAVGVLEDLRARLSLFGNVLDFRALDHPDDRAHALGPFRGQERRQQTPQGGAGASDRLSGDEEEEERFTDVVWVEYETVNNARHAKARAGRKPFFGSMLRLSYAPQDETPHDTALKLAQRRELLLRRARRANADGLRRGDRRHVVRSETTRDETCIGPQLPPLPPPRGAHHSYAHLHSPEPSQPPSAKRRCI